MKLPKITAKTIKEIKQDQKQNFKERMEFVRWHAEQVRNSPNKVWSSQQKKLIE